MVVNGQALLQAAPIKDMLPMKLQARGVSYGLTEAGYDIRIKQQVRFLPASNLPAQLYGPEAVVIDDDGRPTRYHGRFALASAIEEFQMPDCLVGYVKDKSTWARKGLSVFNTVIEPGWSGFLTLELVYHGNTDLVIPAGAGIAQVLFHKLQEPATYTGKYQGQPDMPVEARHE